MKKSQSAYQLELQQLDKNAAEIKRQLDTLEDLPRYVGEDLTEQALEDVRERTRKNLRMAEEEPYFGRMDFKEDETSSFIPLYIGKAGVADEQSAEPLIIDWRAPVSSMFYSFSGGEETAAYRSPEGLIEGEIQLKRNIAIRSKKLQRVVDTYVKGSDNLSASDEFLIYRLGENKDNRLRDIVSTIQSEQNDIIRTEKNTPLIIQGVAGSGKTTVALHRLAYLIYEYREHLLPEKMIIFAPNAMFLDYISNVLPELGVGGIQQTTFNEWALDLLDHEVKLKDPADKLLHWFGLNQKRDFSSDMSPDKLKGSIQFKQLLHTCLVNYEAFAVPDKDFEASEGSVLPVSKIREWFTEQQNTPLAKRRDRIMNRMKNWIASEVKKTPEQHLQKEIKKKASQRLRAYFKSWPKHSPLSFYQTLFNPSKRPDYLTVAFEQYLPNELIKQTMQSCKQKTVGQEDLAALVYIHQFLNGMERKDEFHHSVIDEAQDFSPFQIDVLKQRTNGSSFTILGDLNQGIYDYQGIQNWEEIKAIFNGGAGYFELNKSYRSTMEIIHFANSVLAAGTKPVNMAEPIFRSGNKVKTIKVSEDKRLETLINNIQSLQGGEINSIALVCRTDAESIELHENLIERGISANLIHSGQREYGGGISVLPVYLTKGLEFDAVLIVDADADRYTLTERDAKLLYVGCTRALHDLRIFYSGEASLLLAHAVKAV